MAKTVIASETPDDKIARLEKTVLDLVDAIVKLASERPMYVPCGLPHYPAQPIYPYNPNYYQIIPNATYPGYQPNTRTITSTGGASTVTSGIDYVVTN